MKIYFIILSIFTAFIINAIEKDVIINIYPGLEFQKDFDFYSVSDPPDYDVPVPDRLREIEIAFKKLELYQKIQLNLLLEELSPTISFSNLTDLVNLNLLYLQYPKFDYYPEISNLYLSYADGETRIFFKKTPHNFKNYVILPYKNNISELVVKNNESIIIAYSEFINNKYNISKAVSSYIGKAIFEVFTNDGVTPVAGGDIIIKNSNNEKIANLKVNKKGIAVLTDVKEFLLFDNRYNKPYFYEIVNLNQHIETGIFDISAPVHYALNKKKLVTSLKPLKQVIGEKFDLTGRILFKDHLTKNIIPLKNYKISLYNEKVGTMNIYSKDFDRNLISEVYTDEDGNFVFQDILNYDGKFQHALDVIILLNLETTTSKMVNASLGTEIVYKTILFKQPNVWQFNDKFEVNDLIIDSNNIEYEKIYIFDKINNYYNKFLSQFVSVEYQILTVMYPVLFSAGIFTDDFIYDRNKNVVRLSKQGGTDILMHGDNSRFLIY